MSVDMPAVTLVLLYLVAVVAVVMMWRGFWGLLDEYLFPKNPRLSYSITFIVGFIIIVAALFLM